MKTYYDGKLTCIATHPNEVNKLKNARGRKIHLLKDVETVKTVCNMLFSHESNIIKSVSSRCKICFKGEFDLSKITKSE